jgi:hypothetical protein
MSPTQPGPGFNSTGYSAPEFQSGVPNYQNPLVQAGMHQYLPSPQQTHFKQQAASPLVGPTQPLQSEGPPGYQNQWDTPASIGVRSAASDPQFVTPYIFDLSMREIECIGGMYWGTSNAVYLLPICYF